MDCPKCYQPVETGAAFCGNCGQALRARPVLTSTGRPAYAQAVAADQRNEMHALAALMLGITGIVGGLFMAAIGISLGLAGVIVSTLSCRSGKRVYNTAGLAFSGVAVILGLGVWIHAVRSDPIYNPAITHAAPKDSTVAVSSQLETPCYYVAFIDELNVDHESDSCAMIAYDGSTLDRSTNVYKIYASTIEAASANQFMSLAKTALQNDIRTNLPTYQLDSQKVTEFAGSPAYAANLSDKANGTAITEVIVFHKVSTGANAFVILHANVGQTADLQIIESAWRWK